MSARSAGLRLTCNFPSGIEDAKQGRDKSRPYIGFARSTETDIVGPAFVYCIEATLAIQYNPEKHHRRSIRLTGYDYKQSGAYFVTIVTRNRICLFGDITDGEIVLNDTGRIAEVSWVGLSSRFPTVSLDSFVVMPNHIHGIITVGAQFIAPDSDSVQFIAAASAPYNHVGIAQEGAMNRGPYIRRNHPYL